MKKLNYLVTYDITQPKLLRKVAKYLEENGQRLQKSVFLLKVPEKRIEQIKSKLTKMLNDEQSIIIFPLCRGCFNRTVFLGQKKSNYIIL